MRARGFGIASVMVVLVAVACRGSDRAASSDRAAFPAPGFTAVTRAAGFTQPQSARRTGSGCLLDPARLRATFPALASQITGSIGDRCLPERMSGGVAVADVDGDGAPDVYLTNLDGPGRLYHNRGDGTFVDVTQESGLGMLPAGSNGAAFGDIDNDGHDDLVVTMLATNRYYLFHNRDGSHFDEEAVARGVALVQDRVHTGFTPTFGDVDNDGWLDLYLTEWSSAEWTAGSSRSDQRLLHNLGARGRPGVFEDVTDAKGVATELPVLSVLGFGARLVDLDGDGRSDLVLSSDYKTSRLFWNDGDRFTDGTRPAGVGTDENGMGLTVADYDGDGRPDLFVTSIFGTKPPCAQGYCGYGISGNRLYHNEGGRRFRDVTSRAGVRDGGWGWGAAFVDASNRGRPDLVMTSGVDFPFAPATRRYSTGPMRFWRNDGARRFREIAARIGMRSYGPGKGLVVFDADGDGRADVLVVRDGATPVLYRNVSRSVGHWLDIRVVGHGSNRDGVGAVVRVRADGTARPVVTAVGSVTGFLGQSPNVVHVGLGRARRASVTVRFPATGRATTVAVRRVDRTITVEEPAP
ncbi:MAG: CRTAC1 family protein [Acidimicrobiia bacterium]